MGRVLKSILIGMTWGALILLPAVISAQITPELIEAAKKEGEVMFYGAITINSSKAVGDAFEKKYGIKLHHWRGDATELINRSLAEARAGKPAFRCDARQRSRDERAWMKKICSPPLIRRRRSISQAIPRSGKTHDSVARATVRHQFQLPTPQGRGCAENLGRPIAAEMERYSSAWPIRASM